jgi:hypothetical protein
MQVRLAVTFDQEHGGEKYNLTCGARDILAWEKAGPGRAAAQVVLLSQFKVDDLYSLAFATMRRQKLWSGTEKELRDQAEIDLGHDDMPEEESAAEQESEEDLPTLSGHSNGE